MARDLFGPAWRGLETYRLFAESVKTDLRYVRRKDATDFLDRVLASCGDRKITIPKGSRYWRARLGCDTEEITDDSGDIHVIYDEDRPYSKDKMKPISRADFGWVESGFPGRFG